MTAPHRPPTICAFLALLVLAPPVLAQIDPAADGDVAGDEVAQDDAEAERHERARWFYARGAEAFEAGRFLESVKHFRDASALVPNPALAFNIGLAYDSMGESTDALRWYREYVRTLPEAPDRAEVLQSIRRLERSLAALGVQQVTILSTPAGASVTLDGDAVGETPWTGETTPGPHRVRVVLEGHAPSAAEFNLAEDRALDVKLVLTTAADSVASSRPVSPPSPSNVPSPSQAPRDRAPETSSGPRVRPVTWVTLGGGVGFLGGALGAELSRAQAEQRAREATLQIDAEQSVDDMERRQTLARVLAAVGFAGAIAGGTLLTIDLKRSGRGGSELGTELDCHRSGCDLLLRGRF